MMLFFLYLKSSHSEAVIVVEIMDIVEMSVLNAGGAPQSVPVNTVKDVFWRKLGKRRERKNRRISYECDLHSVTFIMAAG